MTDSNLALNYFRLHGMLNGLERRHTSSDFGRICQTLLALVFKERGFQISHFQLSGRPDFIAERNTQTFAVEVKAPTTSDVMLKREDLLGIERLGHYPVLAVLTYPEIEPMWILLKIDTLPAKRLSKTFLKRFSLHSLEDEINGIFFSVLDKYKEYAEAGVKSLRDILETTSK